MKKVLVRGPALTRTGYGEHCRFVLRALRQYSDHFDIYLIPVNWGHSNWIWEDDEEREWLDKIIKKTAIYSGNGGAYDLSIQVTVPNEWQKMAPVNVGITAGIETNRVAPVWLQKVNEMDKVITISKHSKETLVNTIYEGIDSRTNQKAVLRCNKSVDIVHYPVKTFEKTGLNLKLKTDFNYLCVAQWGPRKNVSNLITWFVEEFFDNPEVGLVCKLFAKGGSIIDKYHMRSAVENVLKKYPDRKCKVYLLHGDLTDQEMHSLYQHPKIKSYVSLSHGEGFGLPHFEAAYSGLPVIAPDWSGHLDFLYMPKKDKKKKAKLRPCFARVDYTLQPIPQEAVWEGVLEKESMWCYPQQGSFKMRLREVYKEYGRFKKQATTLQKWIIKTFSEEKQLNLMAEHINGGKLVSVKAEDLPKISLVTSMYEADDYVEQLFEDITRQTIFKDKCEWIIINANSPGNEDTVVQKYLEKYPDNIIYKKLDHDPGIYDTWNMGIKMATGEYVTNVNCDDRRSPDGLEKQAKLLASNKDVDLVYNDSYLVHEPNIMWESVPPDCQRYKFEEFSKEAMLRGNLPHNNPMWKKDLHEQFGYFNQYYKSAGDWDFWLRCSFGGAQFKKHPEILGVYYFNPLGMSTNPEHDSWKKEHEREIFQNYLELLQQSAA